MPSTAWNLQRGISTPQKKCLDGSSVGTMVRPPRLNMEPEDDDFKVRIFFWRVYFHVSGQLSEVLIVEFFAFVYVFFKLWTVECFKFVFVKKGIFIYIHIYIYIQGLTCHCFPDTCLNQSSISGIVPRFCFHISSWIASSLKDMMLLRVILEMKFTLHMMRPTRRSRSQVLWMQI